MLVGNKVDLEEERAVRKEEGATAAQRFGCGFVEASAKTNTRVNELFYELVRLITAWRVKHPPFNPVKAKKKGGCLLY